MVKTLMEEWIPAHRLMRRLMLGISMAPVMRPWSIGALFQQLSDVVSQGSELDLRPFRQARYRLSLYWLASPTDHLECLCAKEFGAVQRLCCERLGPQQHLLVDEQV